MHYPLGEFVAFHLGGSGKGYSSFQGHIAGVSVRFGPGSVQENVKNLRNEIEMYYNYNAGSVKYNQVKQDKLNEKNSLEG